MRSIKKVFFRTKAVWKLNNLSHTILALAKETKLFKVYFKTLCPGQIRKSFCSINLYLAMYNPKVVKPRNLVFWSLEKVRRKWPYIAKFPRGGQTREQWFFKAIFPVKGGQPGDIRQKHFRNFGVIFIASIDRKQKIVPIYTPHSIYLYRIKI